MPLRQGSSDQVIQHNIKAILNGDAGYSPPYKDPAREEYTPAQAAAIAYAKAGRRNNTGAKKTSASKKTKGVDSKPVKAPKSPSQPKQQEKKDNKDPDIKVPDGWKVQSPGGSADSKKNQPPEAPSKKEATPSPQGGSDEQMKNDVKEGFEHKWGKGGGVDAMMQGWDKYSPEEREAYHAVAKEYLKSKRVKEAKMKPQSSKPDSAPPESSNKPLSKPDGWSVKDQQNSPPSSSSKPTFKVSDQFGFKIPEGRPNFDIKQAFDNGDVTGQEGSFGEVRFNPDKTEVYKQGEIGQNEALAIKKLEKTGVVPEFLGAVIDEQGAIVDDGFGAHVKAAKGYLGMGMAPGRPAGAYRWGVNKLSPQEKTQMLDEYYRVRMVIHSNGIAHNDMHGNNFFYDRDTGKGTCIDFGLAQLSYRAALVEALGTFNGRDWQADGMNDSLIGTPIIKQLQKNVRNVHDEIKSKYGTTVRHEIRSSDEDLDDLPFDEQEAKKYIKMIYQGVFS